MKAMIFAAGLGTRLRPITDSLPKALVPVGGKTLLEWCILRLRHFGITDVVVNIHHFADQIDEILSVNNGFGSNVVISDERAAVLETGGGLKKALPLLAGSDPVFVLNVDVVTNLDLDKFLAFHDQHKPLATLAVMSRASSRSLLFTDAFQLAGWKNLKTNETKLALKDGILKEMAFSGISLLTPAFLSDIPFEGKFSIIDLFLYQAAKGAVLGFDHTGDYFIDVGRPENIPLAEQALAGSAIAPTADD